MTDMIKPRPHKKKGSQLADQTWALLESAIEEIWNKRAVQLSFEELYRAAYMMVLHRHGDVLYGNIEKIFRKRIDFLSKDVVSQNDGDFLKFCGKTWKEFEVSIEMIRDMLMYMDRNYVVSHKKKSIYDLGIDIFRENALTKTNQGIRARNQLLNFVKQERAGKQVDRILIKNAVRMLIETRSYEKYLEEDLLDVTRSHYRAYGLEISRECNVPEYLEKAEKKVIEENQRVNHYLAEGTRKKFEHILRDELVTKHMKFIMESKNRGFETLVDGDQYDSLRRMHELMCNHEQHLNALKEKFKTYCASVGKRYVTDSSNLTSPVEFVKGLFELKEKYDKIVEKSFGDGFIKVLNEAIESCVNGSVQRRLAEYLSSFMDYVIRNVTKFQKEERDTLDRGMVFFRFLADKDVFESYYKIHLSRRLLMASSTQEGSSQIQAEQYFITQLKMECGYNFTSKIEGMFNDMKASNISNKKYLKHKASKKKEARINFHAHVLTASFWPSYTVTKATPPKEMEDCCKSFSTFYSDVYSGRKLTWQTSLGGGIINAQFALGNFEIKLSTYQMMIALLCNDGKEWKFADLVKATNVEPKYLKASLVGMFAGKYNILLKDPETKEIKDSDIIKINNGFNTKVRRFKISAGAASKAEKKEKKEDVKVDRTPQIDSTLIRIMKTRQRYNITKLQGEAIRLLQGKFRANPNNIKERIEALVSQGDMLIKDRNHPQLIIYKG